MKKLFEPNVDEEQMFDVIIAAFKSEKRNQDLYALLVRRGL